MGTNLRYIKIILLFVTACNTVSSFGQTGSVKGVVWDRLVNKGLPYAFILVNGTNKGAVSDQDGNFKIDSITLGTHTLRIGQVGYGDTTITVNVEGVTTIRAILPPACKYDTKIHDSICPVCLKADSVLPITYGVVIEPKKKKDKKKIQSYNVCGFPDGPCRPNWYCRRDKLEF